jgi:succinyl-CoA synthetase beta subunit
MNLHEYQAKKLFSEYGIHIPRGMIAESADEARQAAKTLGGESWVVKAQVHTGGRSWSRWLTICWARGW